MRLIDKFHKEVQAELYGKNSMPASRRSKKQEPGMSFSTLSEMGVFVREKLMESPQRFICDRNHIKKPSDVTKKLIMAYDKLSAYDFGSLKGGVMRILRDPQVLKQVNSHFDKNETDTLLDSDDDDDDLVSSFS